MKKRIFFALIFLIAFFSIGIVCADEISVNDTYIGQDASADIVSVDVNSEVSDSSNNLSISNVDTILDENTIGASNSDKKDVKIDAPDVKLYYKNGTKFIATLSDVDGKKLANQTLLFTISGINYTRTTDNQGQASIAINLNPGTYDLTVNYLGSDKYSPAKKTAKATVYATILGKNLVKYYRNESQYYATFLDNNGDFLKDTNVTFNINGIFYTRKTNGTGVAKLNINLPPNTYILTAIHPKTGYMHSNNVTVLYTIQAKDLNKVFQDNNQYYATFLNGTGQPYVGANVSFNIHGIIYNRITNASGMAKLNINLQPGDYILTAYHSDGSRLSNNIKVIGSSATKMIVNNYTYAIDAAKNIKVTLNNELGYGVNNQTIVVSVNGTTYKATTNDKGVATVKAKLNPGTYTVNYNYVGTGPYKSSSATSTIKVNKAYDATFVVDNTVIYYNNKESFDVTVLTNNNVPVSNQKVYFTINGVTYARTTDKNGTAKMSINLDPGNYKVSYKFNATNYKEISDSSQISVIKGNTSKLVGKDTTIGKDSGQKFKVTLKVGDVPLAQRKVIINVNGVNYTRTTDNNGAASMAVNLNVGKYLVKYYYDGEKRISPSSGQAYVTVKERTATAFKWSTTTTFDAGNNAVMQVTLLDASNKAISNAKVVFTISSKDYTATTNDKGVASLSQKLNPGSYSVSYKYAGSNDYLPSEGVTQITVSQSAISNGYGYWVQGKDMDNVNLSKLASLGTGNIFLNFYAFTLHGESKVLSWIKTANANGIKVHIWMQAFYDGGWVNPVSSDGSVNQAYFNQKITEAKHYAGLSGVSGIHLDYLRYPGNAYKTKGGTEAITEFTKQLTTAVRGVNSNILISAAVMPETTNDIYYYGQNIPALSKYVDVIVPMQYKGNYNAGTSWLGSTTRWFVQNSNGAEVWSGLQTYVSDNDLTKLLLRELTEDAQTVINNGADGVMLFRFGLSNFLNFNSLDGPSYGGSVSVKDVLSAATHLKEYIEANYTLPSKIKVAGESYTTPQMLAMMSQALLVINKESDKDIVALLVADPDNSTGKDIHSKLSMNDYLKVNRLIFNYTSTNKQAPCNITSSLGDIKYETLVYLESRILDYYAVNNKLASFVVVNNFLDYPTLTVNMLPSYSNTKYQYVNYTTTWLNYCPSCGYYGTLLINPKHTHEGELTCSYCDADYCGVTGNEKIKGSSKVLTRLSDSIPVDSGKLGVNVTVKNIVNASVYLKNYIANNSDLPDYIVLPEGKYSMQQFLYLMGRAIVQIDSSNKNPIEVIEVGGPSSPVSTVINATLSKKDYIDVANRTANFILANNWAPNYASSTVGNIVYSELVDSFSRILDSYSQKGKLPNSIKIESSSTPSKSISELAKSLTNGLSSTRDKAVALYNYVRDQISYSFYYNTQKGAEGTLIAGSGNCCDQAQLLVAMARSVNMTVRFATGYCTFSSGSTYGHVWAQFNIDGSWINADPTSTRNSFGVINNWNTNSYTPRGYFDVLPY